MTKGLLLVLMEPPAVLEEEFNDWYDTEHFPQRRALPGVETGARYVCLAGWPRWAALYDLASVDTLDSPAYKAVSGANSTPWSKRLLPRTTGRERIVCEQVAPGDRRSLPPGDVTQLVLARYPVDAGPHNLAALIDRSAGLKGLRQLRLFRDVRGGESWAVCEFDRPQSAERLHEAFGEIGGAGARMINHYTPYLRGGAY